jgi:hypothetical protein
MVGGLGRVGGHAGCGASAAQGAAKGRDGETRDKKGATSIHNLFTAAVVVLRRHKRERIGAKFRPQTFSMLCKIFLKIA